MSSCLSKPPGDSRQRHIPEIAFCEEKARLQDEFLMAIQDINLLLDRQTHAVIDGDADFSRFDILLHVAQQRKEATKYAWIAHVESHGCGQG